MRVALGLTEVVLVYLLVLSYPQPLFSHRLDYRRFTLLADRPLGSEMYAPLDTVGARLAASFGDAPWSSLTVFLPDSPRKFTWLTLAPASVAGAHLPLLDYIYVPPYDHVTNRVHSGGPPYTERSLTGVLAHEATHALVEREIGWWANRRLPVWKREGLADYVARESSFPCELGVSLLLSGQTDPAPSFRYFEYRLLVWELLEGEGVSRRDLLRVDYDPAAVRERALARLRADPSYLATCAQPVLTSAPRVGTR